MHFRTFLRYACYLAALVSLTLLNTYQNASDGINCPSARTHPPTTQGAFLHQWRLEQARLMLVKRRRQSRNKSRLRTVYMFICSRTTRPVRYVRIILYSLAYPCILMSFAIIFPEYYMDRLSLTILKIVEGFFSHTPPRKVGGKGDNIYSVNPAFSPPPCPNNTNMYWEPQVLNFCQVHAINAMLGTPMLRNADVMATLRTRTQMERRAIVGIQYDTTTGNFSDQAINFALQNLLTHGASSDSDRVCLVPVHPSQGLFVPGSTKGQILSRLPSGHQEFNLAWYGGTEVHEGSYGHAMCLRCVDGQWHRINSEMTHFPDGTTVGQGIAPMLGRGLAAPAGHHTIAGRPRL